MTQTEYTNWEAMKMLYNIPFGDLSSKFAKSCYDVVLASRGKDLQQNYERNQNV